MRILKFFLIIFFFFCSIINLYSRPGDIIWSHTVRNQVNYTPLVANDRLYFDDKNNYFYCLNAESGKEVWKYQMNGSLAEPAFQNGKIIITGFRKKVLCLTADKGELLWQSRIGYATFRPPFISENRIIITTQGDVRSLDISTGQEQWNFYPGISTYLRSNPAISNKTIYLSGESDRHCYAIDINSGTLKWKSRTGPVLDSGTVTYKNYVIIGSFQLKCLSRETGQSIWDHPVQNQINGIPYVDSDKVYFMTGCNLYAVSLKSGKLMKRYNIYNKCPGSMPLIFRDSIFFGAAVSQTKSYLFCLSKKTGKVKWKKSLPGKDKFTNISLVKGKLYFTASRKIIYCIDSGIKDATAYHPDSTYFRYK